MRKRKGGGHTRLQLLQENKWNTKKAALKVYVVKRNVQHSHKTCSLFSYNGAY
jgi:hypothetical protein